MAEDLASAELQPEDSDVWLAEGGKDLDQQLAQRQAELNAAKAKSSSGRRGGSAAAPGDDFDAHVMAKRMQVRCTAIEWCQRGSHCERPVMPVR